MGGLITKYLGYGLAASRPADPAVPADALAFYVSSDTGAIEYWDDDTSAWIAVVGSGDMLGSNNLSDIVSATTARTNLGLAIGTNVQAYDAELAALAGLTSAADKGIQFTGSGTAATFDLTAAGKALLDDADAAAQRTTLGLGTAALLSTADVDERARDALGTALTEGAGIDLSVVDGSDTITITVDPSELEATTAEVWAGTSSAKVVTPKILRDSTIPTALTSGTTITPDFNAGLNFSLTLAHNATLANPTNAQIGDSGVIVITQDGTGTRTLAYGTNWKFPGGAEALSTAAGSIDIIVYYVAASGVIHCGLTKAYSS